MFALGIRYLNGWAMATHPADRRRPEWPPHPDRVFMALAAAHFETRDDPPTEDQLAERRALEWLEGLAALDATRYPRLEATAHEERLTVTTFVPVNDTESPLKGSGKNVRPLMPSDSLPVGRDRQPREFPAAIPHDSTAYLVWDSPLPSEHEAALARLSSKVTYVGHSASLVQMWVERRPPASSGGNGRERRTLVPVPGGAARYRLRVTAPGRLADLEERFAAGQRPTPSLWCGYDEPRRQEAPSPARGTSWSPELIILRRASGPAFGLATTLQLAEALRGTVLSGCPEPIPEWVSGHTPGGSPSRQEHLAFLSLPYVGFEHADGHVLGLALAVPRAVPLEQQAASLRSLLYDDLGSPRRITLRMGRVGTWEVELEERDPRARPLSLRSELWTAVERPAARWATVTPIALDRHPKGSDRWAQIEACVARACQRIDLPEPVEIQLSPVSMFAGAPHVREVPNLIRKGDGGKIYHTHAVITFGEPVYGPVLLGAGRYRGYGLCRPFAEGDDAA